MPTVEQSIDVDATRERVFDLWTDFERFPAFMENVKEVRRVGEDKTHWVVEAAGQKIEWDADTTVKNGERVAWKAQGDSGQSGVVTFEDIGPARTRVNVSIDYKLDSKLQEAGARTLGVDDHIVAKSLEHFKELVEGRPHDIP